MQFPRMLIDAVLRAARILQTIPGSSMPLVRLHAQLVRELGPAVGSYGEIYQQLKKRTDSFIVVDEARVLAGADGWPGVVREAETDAAPVVAAALDLLRESLRELNDTRAREGQRIHELIGSRCASMRGQVVAVKGRLPEVSQRLRDRIVERISQLGVTPDPDRLEQELVMYSHKMDVDEELDRLSGHLDEVTNVLDSSEPSGRRLDFLMQELNREANTLSSKSQDVETTRAAVDMKVMIEQMREQVQNVE